MKLFGGILIFFVVVILLFLLVGDRGTEKTVSSQQGVLPVSGGGGGLGYSGEQAFPLTVEHRALIKDGTVMISPISGKRITKNANTPGVVYKNRLYFFCCSKDMSKFAANPELYTSFVPQPNGMEIPQVFEKSISLGQSIEQTYTPTAEERAFIEDGTEMVSPVSGKRITKNSTTPCLVYNSKLYFFCCSTDMNKFAANPGLYTNSVSQPNGMEIPQFSEGE